MLPGHNNLHYKGTDLATKTKTYTFFNAHQNYFTQATPDYIDIHSIITKSIFRKKSALLRVSMFFVTIFYPLLHSTFFKVSLHKITRWVWYECYAIWCVWTPHNGKMTWRKMLKKNTYNSDQSDSFIRYRITAFLADASNF